jgi:hypothetical protein
MNLKRMLCASSLAVGVGLTGLLGVGAGTANADPGQPCGAPKAPVCQQGPQQDGRGGPRQDGQGGPQQGPPPDVAQRGIDQGRQDHRPFMYGGQQVDPVFDNNHNGWGFWFFGMWIPL